MRLQSGIPMGVPNSQRKPNGLTFRGVVTATYVTDDPNHPYASTGNGRGVYCDVLALPLVGGARYFGLQKVPVLQESSGMHHGRICKPRPTTIDITDTLTIEPGQVQASNPGAMDGDHVLIGFMNNNFNQPLIQGCLPHPAVDEGNESGGVGRRMHLTLADGDPDFFKHHGTFYGVDKNGNHVVDTRFANDGILTDKGKEAGPPTDGKGSISRQLPQDALYTMTFEDMSNPDSPTTILQFQIKKDQLEILVNGNNILKVADDSTLQLGDGSEASVIASTLQTLWGQLVSALTAHVHVPAGGPSPQVWPAWNAAAASQKLTFPSN